MLSCPPLSGFCGSLESSVLPLLAGVEDEGVEDGVVLMSELEPDDVVVAAPAADGVEPGFCACCLLRSAVVCSSCDADIAAFILCLRCFFAGLAAVSVAAASVAAGVFI